MKAVQLAGPGILILLAIAVMTLYDQRASLVEPGHGSFIGDRRPHFIWQGGGTEFWIDTNPEFTTPLIIEAPMREYTLTEELELGTYYWKVPPSDTFIFTIDGNVQVELDKDEGSYEMRNTGNTPVKVSGSRITGAIIGIGETEEFTKEETGFEVRQHG